MKNLILSLCFTSLVFSQDHSVAVLDFSGENIHQDELIQLSAVFRTELLRMDTLRVMDYDDMSKILLDYGYKTPTCGSIECNIVSSILLDQEWLITAHVSKIGDVFLIEARLIDSQAGRVINAVSYDFEQSLEGLYTRGMHNLSELVMSKRIPLEVHQRQNLVYFKTNPSSAKVRVGKDTLNGQTPLAIDRVVVESRPIILFKDGYQPFKINQLPEDNSDVIFIDLMLKTPKEGSVVFNKPIPADVVIVEMDGNQLLIEEGDTRYDRLPVGYYKLDSELYVIRNNEFRIQHRRTTKSSPTFFPKREIQLKSEFFLKRRNLYLKIIGGGLLYRSFLTGYSSYLYSQYSTNTDKADERHRRIDNLDSQKPIIDVLSTAIVFPAIYYQAKHLEMERWLKN